MRQQLDASEPEAQALREAQRSCVDDVRAAGLTLDAYDLIIPAPVTPDLRARIAPTLLDARARIRAARDAGKHVLYLPGSYDLVHVGHASFVLQSIDAYCAEHPELTRDDLFVVVLADDDDLIRVTKASKWIGKGGTELFRRPVQSTAAMASSPELPSRLHDLASLPVDLVGYLPSPHAYLPQPEALMIAPHALSEALDGAMMRTHFSPEDAAALRAAVQSYAQLCMALRTDPYGIRTSFEAWQDYAVPSEWMLQSWQLVLHQFLVGSPAGGAPITRLVSTQDRAYADQVAFLMEQCGINVEFLEGTFLCSSTDLLATHGQRALLEAKRRASLTSTAT